MSAPGIRWLVGTAGRRLAILIFHRVLIAPDPLFPGEVDAARFAAQLGWLRSWFEIVDLRDGIARLREGTLPARSLAITFDDGYADNCTVAVPILQRFGAQATFFIASGFLDGGRMWNDTVIESIRRCPRERLDLTTIDLGEHDLASPSARRVAIDRLLPGLKHLPPRDRQARVDAIAAATGARLPDDLMLSTAQLRDMHTAGMAIGAHTISHPILTALEDDAARAEIGDGRTMLESRIDAAVPLFAYPNGKPDRDYSAVHVSIVREAGFEAAVTTAPGAAGPVADFYQLPRFTPWDRSEWRYGLRLARNLRAAPAVASAT